MNGQGRMFPRMVGIDPVAPGSLTAHILGGDTRPFLPDHASVYSPPSGGAKLPASVFRAASEEAASLLEEILAGDGDFVSTGQQPGLFLGPRYTLYKAASAIACARTRAARLGRPCLALFWIAADDHDWEEVGSCRVLNGEGRIEVLRLVPPAARTGRSVGESRLEDDVEALVRRLEGAVEGAARGTGAAWLEAALAGYRRGETVSGAFAEGMMRVFAGHPIVFLDSSTAEVRLAGRTVYEQVLGRPRDILTAVTAGGRGVEQAGYEPALRPPANGLQIFVDHDGGREHLLFDDGGFRLGGARMGDTEIRKLLEDRPSAFTPAAALRPVLESALLPVGETILGPGEVAYWAQLPPLFETVGIRRPNVKLRDAWLAVEPRVDRWLDGLGLTAQQIGAGTDVTAEWIGGRIPPRVAGAFEDASGTLIEGFDELRSAIMAEFPGLISAEGKARHRAEEALADLRSTVERQVAEREAVNLDRLRRARMHLRPGGQAQERALAGVTLYGRYGPAWIERLIEISERPAGER